MYMAETTDEQQDEVIGTLNITAIAEVSKNFPDNQIDGKADPTKDLELKLKKIATLRRDGLLSSDQTKDIVDKLKKDHPSGEKVNEMVKGRRRFQELVAKRAS